MYWSQGDFDKAIKYHKQWLAIAKEGGDRAGEGRAYGGLGAHSTTPTSTTGKDSPAREPSRGVLVAETIHPACMCEGGGRGGRKAGAHSTTYTAEKDSP